MRRAAAAAVLAVLLVGCGGYDGPEVGRVTAKGYDDADTWTQCQLVGKVPVCSPYTDPERWSIEVDGHRLGVDEAEWLEIDEGDCYDVGLRRVVELGCSDG